VFAGFLTLSIASVKLTEAAVAVGDEWAHAQFIAEGHGFSVEGFSFFGSRGIAMRRDLAQNQQSPRLRPSRVVTGELEGLAAESDRVLCSIRPVISLAQIRSPSDITAPVPHRDALREPLLEKRQAVGNAPG